MNRFALNGFKAVENRWIAVNFGLSVLMAAALGVNAFWLQPRIDLAEAQAGRRSELQIRLNAARGARDSLLAQKERLGSEAERLATFRRKGLPDGQQAQNDLQRVVYRALETTGLTVTGVTYSGGSMGDKKNLRRLTAGFNLIGTYAKLKLALATIEASPEFVLLDDFSITARPPLPGESVVNLQMQVKISVFYQPAGQPGMQDGLRGRGGKGVDDAS